MSDGRSFATLDFDGDGWTDIALMSLNHPRFRLYRNRMRDLYPDRKSFRFKLVGGNDKAEASEVLSNRSAIGARVLFTFKSGRKVRMHKQAGEGFATQNSEIQSIAVPSDDEIEKAVISWPSGNQSTVTEFELEKVMQFHEQGP